MVEFGLIDWILWIGFFVLFLLILYIYKVAKQTPGQHKYFLCGFVVKALGGLIFALVYRYYYGFGDTFLYFKGGETLVDTATSNFGTYIRLLLSESNNLDPDLANYHSLIPYSKTYEEWFMVKLLSPIIFCSFKSYLLTTLILSGMAFFGSWKLYKVFNSILEERHGFLSFFSAFLVPTVIFWGSGILKDTITLACFNYLIYLLYFTVFKGKFSSWRILIVIVVIYIIVMLKAYILISLIPGIVFAIYLRLKNSIQSDTVRLFLGPIIFAVLIGGALYTLIEFTQQEGKYNAEKLESRVRGFHTWHRDVGGSYYDLGEVDYTFWGVVRKIPAALNVTFFRPYLWEANNLFLLLSALESIMLLMFFLFVLFRSRFRFFRILNKEPILLGLIVFILFFAFAVGFTSYNFGALARYKIPIESLVVFILFFISIRSGIKGTHKKQASHQSSFFLKNVS